MDYSKTLDKVVAGTLAAWQPPPELSLSEWAAQYARLSHESSAEPGKWVSIPYQDGIMDAFTDPEIEVVVVKKSARVGYTKIINNVVGYHIHLDPCNILVVQPTIEDAEGYSKDEIATMIRDTPIITELVSDPKTRDGSNTILKKSFPQGMLYLVGANSPRGFRRISARLVLFDEIDGYPASAGTEGDQIKLGIMRSNFFWNRKIAMGSTPTIAGESKIDREFENSDKRFYFVPCPHCGEYQTLKWSNIQWPENDPARAFYVCEHCASIIDHSQKHWMVERGEWRATQEFPGRAGFFIWAGYSYSPNAAWGKLATEFLECKRDSEALQTFVNTVLGESFQAEREAVDWAPLYERREDYAQPAAGAYVITAGVDVQADRVEVGVEGWAPGEENWQIEYAVIFGDTSESVRSGKVWLDLQAFLSRVYENDRGVELGIAATCIDSGYRTERVYEFVKRNRSRRVYATKGRAGPGLPIVDTTSKKKTGRDPRPVRVFNLGVDGAKAVIYYRLQQNEPGDGYRHFSKSLGADFFEGLTAEEIRIKKRRGHEIREWHKIRPRNEQLDIAVLNLAALRILNPTWEVLTETAKPVAPIGSKPPSHFARRSGSSFTRR